MVMVEPFLLTLNSLLSNPVALARPSLLQARTRTAMHALQTDIATRLKRIKGKEKALPDTDWLLYSQWLFTKKCASTISPARPRRPNDPIPGGSHVFPHAKASPHPCRSLRALPSLLAASPGTLPSRAPHRAQARHHFSTNAGAARRPQDAPNPVELLDRFTRGRPYQDKPIEVQDAWESYNLVRDRNSVLATKPEIIIPFVDRMATGAEALYTSDGSLDALNQWATLLMPLLSEVESLIEPVSPEAFSRQCLWVRCMALAGDIPAALSGLTRMELLRDGEDPAIECRAYESLLLAIHRTQGPVKVLEIICQKWTALGGRIFDPQYRYYGKAVNDALKSLSDTAFSILDDIEFPAAVVAARRDKGDRAERLRAGELLITFLIVRRCPEDAFAVLEELHQQGLRPNLTLQLELVLSLVRNRVFELANRLYSTLSTFVEPGAEPREYIMSGLHLFAHQGDVDRVEHYFGVLKERNAVGVSSISLRMHVHALHGDTARVVQLFHEELAEARGRGDARRRARIHHYTSVIMAHAQRRDFDGINTWLEEMVKAGIRPDRYVYEVILNSFAMRGEVDEIGTVLQQMFEAGFAPNEITYTTVITLLAERRDAVAAEAIYKQAIREGVVPDRQMIAALMNAHAEVGSWRGVIRAFDYMTSSKTRQIRPRMDVFNILLKAYVLIGTPFETVSRIFRKIEDAGMRPSIHTFTLLIQSACDSGLMDVAATIFQELEKLAKDWETGFQTNAYALTVIMAGYLRLGHKAKAKEVYDDMLARGIQPTSVTFGAILRGYSNEGTEENLQLAQDFLRSLMDSDPNDRAWLVSSNTRLSGLEHIYGPLMSSHARRSSPEQVEALFQDMIDQGGEPTLSMLTLLLNSYRKARDADSARKVWRQIVGLGMRYSKVEGLFSGADAEPPREDLQRQASILCVPLSIYMDVLSASGFHLEVADVWQKLKTMHFTFDSHNWNHLVAVLVRAGEPLRAFGIVERIILPYRHQLQHAAADRERAPETPLLFDDEMFAKADDLDEIVPARADRTFAAERRAAAVRLATPHAQLLRGRGRDFAHPLHILYQISPSWQAWRPHRVTMLLLSMVLDHLESGRLIQPILPDDAPASWDEEWDEDQSAKADALIEMIQEACPETLQAVRDFRTQESAQAEIDNMIYSKQPGMASIQSRG